MKPVVWMRKWSFQTVYGEISLIGSIAASSHHTLPEREDLLPHKDRPIVTSEIQKIYEEDDDTMVETRNTIYKLIGAPSLPGPMDLEFKDIAAKFGYPEGDFYRR